ncbi:MAG: hypothetical protein NTV73_03840 [Hyphomicrobiales bacterium]|nr:hypothetical protein [Hyphomicrobiales bacterium]
MLALVPYLENRRLAAEADVLVAGDKAGIGVLPTFATLAYVQYGTERRDSDCGDFCQRALLNAAAAQIIMVASKTPGKMPADDFVGRLYRLDRMASCPAPALREGERIDIPGEHATWGEKTPGDLLRLKAAQGICLTARDATLSEADAVLVTGRVKQGQSPDSAGLSLAADTVSAERLALFVRQDGELVERYRATGVTYYPMLPVLLPSYAGGYGLELRPGFLRSTAFLGDAERYRPKPSLGLFLAEKMRFDLALRDTDAVQVTREVIAAALDRDGPIDRAGVKVMQDFFETMSRRKDAEKADATLALRVLADRRVPVPRNASAPVRRFAADDAALASQFAAVLFGRLFEIDPEEKEDDSDYLGYPLAYLSDAIANLPDDALLPYRADLETLARDRRARVNGYVALRRLGLFGVDTVPTLIFLIDDSAAAEPSRSSNAWQHPYLAGVQGLCGLGRAGNAAVPLLYERLQDGRMVRHGAYWDLTINTLVSLGADPEEAWTYMQSSEQNYTRDRFDSEVRRAQRKIDCSY